MNENRNFKGIWIPKHIWLNENLSLQEKVFLVEIDSLDNSKGCFASNKYFSDFFGLSKTRVSLVIKSLIDKQFISSTLIYKEGTKEILNRVVKVSYIPYVRKVKDPPLGKLKDNNTVNNTVNKKTKGIEDLDVEFEEIVVNKNQLSILDEIKEKEKISDKKEKFNFRKEMISLGFEEELVLDWLAVRKTKKATNTKTALKTFLNQVKQSGKDQNYVLEYCVSKSWSGFKAIWLEKEEDKENPGDGNSAVDNLIKAMKVN